MGHLQLWCSKGKSLPKNLSKIQVKDLQKIARKNPGDTIQDWMNFLSPRPLSSKYTLVSCGL